MSIAWAVAEHIHNRIGAKTLFATHYHELTELAGNLPHVKNLNVAVREWNNQVVFLYKLVEGGSDHSYGIHVAKLAGLPPEVIERARNVLSDLETTGMQRDSRPVSEPAQMQLFAPAPTSAVEQELKKLDLDRLTPLEALSKLAELRNKIK
jgi:DNA mismatch repair protein MutS